MPVDWLQVPLGEVCRIEIGGTPSRNVPRFWADKHSGYPWLSIADLKASRVYDTAERITDAGVRNSNVKPIPANTPVMSFKLTIGRAAVAGVNMYSNEAIAAFHADSTVIAPGWLFYELPRAALRGISDTAVKGSTLNKAKLRKLPLELPPLPEQRQIAEILDTLDEAIRKTEQIIAKLQQVKQGLLHDLLTRGIDDNGELRDPDRHPEQFKDSPLGRIPRAWDTTELGAIATVDRGKFTHRPRNDPAYYGGGIPFIQTGDVAAADGDLLFTFSQTLNARGASVSKEFPVGTIAITIAANIADTAILGIPMFFPDSIVGAVVHPPNDVRFAELCVRRAKPLLEAQAPQSAQKNINLQDLRPLIIPHPSFEEQSRIAAVYDALTGQAAQEVAQLSKLRLLKSGLMEDLLTGRVRVTKLLEQAAE